MTSPLYPLRFWPLFRRYLWGGRRLATVLGKSLGEGDDYAESWEIVDHGADQSIVQSGALAGVSLQTLVANRSAELLGKQAGGASFPLLFKFLDCQRALSVQVHPTDAQAARLTPPDLGKTEAWVILDAQPGSCLYAGLKRGFDRAALEREVARGTTELCLHRIEPQVGDCIFIPAGTVHALGAGLLVAEIQQSSDTTFRLFDWNRVDATGQARPLHIEQSLDTIDFSRGPLAVRQPTAGEDPSSELLVRCDKFVLQRRHLVTDTPLSMPGRCRLLAVTEGEVLVEHDPAGRPLVRGECMLLPACLDRVTLTPLNSATVLDVTLP